MANNPPDQELLLIFLEESTDLVASLSATMRQWEKNLNELSLIADLKRDLHTLKGSARMVGQMAIGRLAHELETLAEALAKGQVPVDQKVFNLINLGQDRISLMIESLRKNEAIPAADDLIQQFYQYIPKGEKTEAKSETPAETPKAAVKKEEKVSVQPTAEVIRVRSDLLEKLDNLSTENSMIRVNLEQQISSFSTYLQELKEGTRRLESQLTTLDAEVETDPSRAVALTQISNGIKETNIDFVNALKNLNDTTSTMESYLLNQARINAELQQRLSSTRLVPFESIIPRLGRIARQVSTELNKAVDFKVTQSEGDMDRTVLEHLVPSLEHILRNALDHGIEPTDVRTQKGKPPVGKIEVSFTRAGSTVAIEITDDGGGINTEAVRKKAIKLGMLTPDAVISDNDVMRFIMEPGFSTREAVSEISGRGVGMDVVNMAVKEMGGTLNIDSEIDKGTKFTIRFPFTISLNRVMLFTVQDQIYGVLLANIESIISIKKEQVNDLSFSHLDKSYSLHYLGSLLKMGEEEIHIPRKETFPVILFSASNYSVALVIDSVLYNRELVVQALGNQFKLMNLCSGITLLGNGQVVYILDPYTLATKVKGITAREQVTPLSSKGRHLKVNEQPMVMVVDDSVSVRTVSKRFLERNHYKVITAKDGIEALQTLEETIPDLILLDIDMPRMDGFEFVISLRQDDRFKEIPIIIITSRPTEHRLRAEQLNVANILGKPYQESELLPLMKSLLGKKS